MYHDDIEQDDFMAIIEQAATYARGMVSEMSIIFKLRWISKLLKGSLTT